MPNVHHKRSAATAMLLASLAFAASAAPQTKKPAPAQTDQQVLRAYVLTRYKVRQLGEAISDLADYQDAYPDVASAMTASGPQADIAHLAARVQKFPEVVALLRKDGFTPREYVVAQLTLNQALHAVVEKAEGGFPDYPASTVKLIGRTNLIFVESDLDEIVSIIDALSPPSNAPPSDSDAPGLIPEIN